MHRTTTHAGKGNGGTVLKALHLPTMKLVALKSVPIYSAERRQQMVQVSQRDGGRVRSIEWGN